MANVLIKWVAYYYGRKSVNTEVEWEINEGLHYALPKNPNKAMTVNQIFAELRGQPRFRLPLSSELRNNVVLIEGRELVRDGLPQGFLDAKEFGTGDLVVWNGKETEYLTAAQVSKYKFSWRLEFVL